MSRDTALRSTSTDATRPNTNARGPYRCALCHDTGDGPFVELPHACPKVVCPTCFAELRRMLIEEPEKWADRPTPEDDAIEAAFPTETGRHELYGEAMRLVGDRRSKGALVALVNWLLFRLDTAQR